MNARFAVAFAIVAVLLPFILASTLAKIVQLSRERRIALAAGLCALVFGYFTGAITFAAGWLSAPQNFRFWMPPLFVATSVVGLCLWKVRRDRFYSFRWPQDLGENRFARWCARYMRRAGWKITEPERLGHIISFQAIKGQDKWNVVCCAQAPTQFLLQRLKTIENRVLVTGSRSERLPVSEHTSIVPLSGLRDLALSNTIREREKTVSTESAAPAAWKILTEARR